MLPIVFVSMDGFNIVEIIRVLLIVLPVVFLFLISVIRGVVVSEIPFITLTCGFLGSHSVCVNFINLPQVVVLYTN